MTTLAPVVDASKLAQGFNVLRQWADTLIDELPEMTREQVMDCARNANEMESQGFRIRGACAAELKRRIRQQVMGDERRIGEAMDAAARELGVNFHTLKDDCRIFETFGAECLSTNNVPREVYRLALTAREPRMAVEMYADRKAQDGRYSTLDFRRDMSDANRGRELRREAVSDSDTREVTWDLTREVLREVKQTAEALACSDEQAVTYLVLYGARARKAGQDIRARA